MIGRCSSALLVLAATLGLAGCSNSAQPEAARPDAVETSVATTATAAPTVAEAPTPESFAGKVFGQKPAQSEEIALSDLVKNAQGFADKPVKTRGVVKAVCKKAGCWMEIATPTGEQAHIKMAGHGFFVPKNCAGHEAIVEGTVKPGAPSNECGSKDSCGGHANGAVAQVEFVATGVEFLN